MEAQSIFKNISPLDHRYYLTNRELFDQLKASLSEEATIAYRLKAEIALLKTHIHFQRGDDQRLYDAADKAAARVTVEDVYAEEEKTQHDLRALVNVLKRYVPETLNPYVHLGATSVDIIDTAFAMRIRDAVRGVVLPLLIELESLLIMHAKNEAETPQVGRTHGQHAVPITFGFAVAEYVGRLGSCVVEIDRRSADLRGKLSGAVGAYNAMSIIAEDPEGVERYYLDLLGLKPGDISTQMVGPEYLLRLLFEINTAFGVIANLADDLRHLQRSEIDEVREYFSSEQVGSSTMPQKRNPWNSEHVKSLWKAYYPRIITFFADQISEHQRDLSNSASGRFVVEFVAGFAAAAERMRRIIERLAVHRDRMSELLNSTGSMVLAEPAYILLALAGSGNAHEIIRKITLESEEKGEHFGDVLRRHQEAWDAIKRELEKRGGIDAGEFFASPDRYRGIAAEKANQVASKYESIVKHIKEKLI